MKRITPGIGSFETVRNVDTPSTAGPTALGDPPKASVSNTASAHRQSLKNRMLSWLGLTPTATSDASNTSKATNTISAARFTQAGVAPTTGTGLNALPYAGPPAGRQLRRGNRDTEMLAHAIRNQIAGLPPAVGERFAQQLRDYLQRSDPSSRIALLTMLEREVLNAAQGNQASLSGRVVPLQPGRRSTVPPTRHHTLKLVAARHAGVEVQLSDLQEQQILAIRVRLLRLPGPLASDYRLLLRDVIASCDSAKCTRLLNQMASQIDEHLAT